MRAHIKFKCSYTLSEISPNRAFLPSHRNGMGQHGNAKAFRFRAFAHPDTPTVKSSTHTRDSAATDVKNGLDFSRAGNGMDYSKPGLGLDFSSKPGNGLDFSSKPGNGLDFSSKPGNGLDFSSKPGNGLDFSSKPGTGLDFSKPGNGLDFSTKSAKGLDFSKPENGLDSTTSSSSSSSSSSSISSISSSAAKTEGSLDFSKHHSGSEFSKPFSRYAESRLSRSPPSALSKRPSGDDSPFRPASSPKMPRVLEPKAELLSPNREEHSRMLSKLDRSPRKTPPDSVLKDSHSDVASAFRKVERSSTPEASAAAAAAAAAERPSSGGSSSRAEENCSLSPVMGSVGVGVSMPLPPPGLHAPPPLSGMARLSGPVVSGAGLPTAMPGSLMGMYMPRLPLGPHPPPLGLPPTPGAAPMHHVTSHHPAFAAADQIPPGLLEMCRATIPSIGPLTESFANIRNGDGHGPGGADFPGKAGLFLGGGGGGVERGGGGHHHHPVGLGTVPFLKSNNPMVEKILQSTGPTLMTAPMSAINMSQNWCAKCNATFRMTSDLVYHMRSHHKREFDPMKRKREEKLKCTICNETFRERHHLTRHMSSHA